MQLRPTYLLLLGATLSGLAAVFAAQAEGTATAAWLSQETEQAIAKSGGGKAVTADFTTRQGWPTRHPLLHGGGKLNDMTRARIARAVAAVRGVGAVSWADGARFHTSAAPFQRPLHCQNDVEALLSARTIRFAENSAAIDRSSRQLIGEVAQALRPCLGSVIAIIGHTDSVGDEAENILLSQRRAEAIQHALVTRGIPADGLRASGVGSNAPVEGLEPDDPANRRIEFSVLETVPLDPTPIDIPGAR